MAQWEEDDGKRLEPGFITLRVETNRVQCLVMERLPPAGPEAAGPLAVLPPVDPLAALCRCVRLAPAGYRQFAWAAAQPDAVVYVEADEILHSWNHFQLGKSDCIRVAAFQTMTALAGAIRPYANAEGLVVDMTSGDHVMVLTRNSGAPGSHERHVLETSKVQPDLSEGLSASQAVKHHAALIAVQIHSHSTVGGIITHTIEQLRSAGYCLDSA